MGVLAVNEHPTLCRHMRVPSECPECTHVLARRALANELDQPYEPPTTGQHAAVETYPTPYPLMRQHRQDAPVLTLVVYLFRVVWWRLRWWRYS